MAVTYIYSLDEEGETLRELGQIYGRGIDN